MAGSRKLTRLDVIQVVRDRQTLATLTHRAERPHLTRRSLTLKALRTVDEEFTSGINGDEGPAHSSWRGVMPTAARQQGYAQLQQGEDA